MGGMSILRHFRLPDRPHYHSGIFFLLASIFDLCKPNCAVTCKSEPKKTSQYRILTEFRKAMGGRCVGYREQTGVFIFLHVEVRRRAMR
jgi:hypothetical protein